MKIQKHIEIMRSTQSALSSMSKASCDAIFELLSSRYENVHVSTVNNIEDLEGLAAKQPDLVFVGMKFVPTDTTVDVWDSPKVWVTEYLDEKGIAYTGSGNAAHNLELDKSLAKAQILSSGLSTSPFTVVKQGQTSVLAETSLSYPLFVKPTNRGAGSGIDSNSVVHTYEALAAKTDSLFKELGADSLVEEFLPGREFSVAILKDELTDDYLAMPLELIAPKDEGGFRILTSAIKSADTERFTAIARGGLRDRITALALDAFHAIGAQDYGRIDIRLDQFGTPHFLEANLIPSLLKDYGNFPKACMLNAGMDYQAVILHIVRLGMRRAADDLQIAPVLRLFPAVA